MARLEGPKIGKDKIRVRKKGVFWKGGLFRKVHFLEILENLEITESLENRQTVENKGESDHFLVILESLEIVEILEIPPVKKTPFVMNPLSGPEKSPLVHSCRKGLQGYADLSPTHECAPLSSQEQMAEYRKASGSSDRMLCSRPGGLPSLHSLSQRALRDRLMSRGKKLSPQ